MLKDEFILNQGGLNPYAMGASILAFGNYYMHGSGTSQGHAWDIVGMALLFGLVTEGRVQRPVGS